ncbi:hypothetical protein [Phreatobacter stygius]|uniref:Uncharacterized protein n=1 Tax=Phreatobacter stygius TaxID=1940610 RepID=A0A4D7B9X6_9HYPH|nr:hypothetical protein [Phreatobacter stygius]QCI66316.1 hypothetical protein E8M01_20095 [Phreatobacter stygius]
MTATKPIREILPGTVADAVATVGAMGRVMLAASAGGATHERIGPVAAVRHEAGTLRLSGEAHDALIDLAVIVSVVADRSGRMKDRVLPRLELLDAAGETAFSLICLDGLEPFDKAIEGLGAGTVLPEKARQTAVEPGPAPAGDDPGANLLEAARAGGEAVTVLFRCTGLEQTWTGIIGEVKPAMGFLNIIQPDFHLHLKDHAVAHWRRDASDGAIAFHAEAADGSALGLVLSGPGSAFAGA